MSRREVDRRAAAHTVLDEALDTIGKVEEAAASGAAATSAEDQARQRVADLLRQLDSGGAISRAYAHKAQEPEVVGGRAPSTPPVDVEQRRITLILAAHLLADLGPALSERWIRARLAVVTAGLIDLSRGNQVPAVLQPLPLGRGRRAPSVVTGQAAWPRIIQLVFYKAGLEAQSVEEAWAALSTQIGVGVGEGRFAKRKRELPKAEREFAQKLGAAVAAGHALAPKQEQLRAELDALLARQEALRRLGQVAAGTL